MKIVFFYDQVKEFIDNNKANMAVYKRCTKKEKPTKYGFSPKDTQSSTQTRVTWLHQKKLRDQRLLLNCAKLVSTPSNSLLFLSFHMIHISVKGVTFLALCFLFLAPLFPDHQLLHRSWHYP